VELTRRFQHFAFGSALTRFAIFQQAEDIVQGPLSGLDRTTHPRRARGNLRAAAGIVRITPSRVAAKQLRLVPLAEAEISRATSRSPTTSWNSAGSRGGARGDFRAAEQVARTGHAVLRP